MIHYLVVVFLFTGKLCLLASCVPCRRVRCYDRWSGLKHRLIRPYTGSESLATGEKPPSMAGTTKEYYTQEEMAAFAKPKKRVKKKLRKKAGVRSGRLNPNPCSCCCA